MPKINKYYFLFIFSFLLFTTCEDNESDSGGLFINEFLASNDTCCTDEEGEFDDWVELYNSSSDPIDVGGMFIADNLNDDLYLIPNSNSSQTTVPANGYLILWFDKDEEQGILHLKVKLSADGESVILIDKDGVSVIDSLTFESQKTDVSMGRDPSNFLQWKTFTNPTPGFPNN